ncbi:MAG: MmgE/PrpD family protein, partial [Acidaminococcaceae bacterium]|nr:MmgE/PrpD family protein [Acidaminococcaceae bacterium]
NYLINNPVPKNPYGCKFSIQYCTSAMLKNGVVGIEEFAPEVIQDPIVRDLMNRTEVILDAEMEKVQRENPAKLASKVVLVLKDGRTLERQVDFPKGDPDNPMTWNEARAKFMHLAVPVYGEEKSEKLCQLVEHLEKCEDFAKGLAECLGD